MTSSDTDAHDPAGIDVEPVTAWLAEHVGTVAPLEFTRLPGGHSNLTYRIQDAEGRLVVLRRPPLGHLLPTAHDMGREHTLIAALGPTPVPVPEALAHCTDPEVIGAPFYVMAHVEGAVLHSAEIAEQAFPADMRETIGNSFIDVLAELHQVEPDDVGLGGLAKKEAYIERQLKRWHSQYEASKTEEDELVARVYTWLKDNIPQQGPARVVHGDYRLGNCITGPDGHIAAVLDWEIATLGDPLADLGYVLATWPEPGETQVRSVGAPSALPGFPSRDDLTERYAKATGSDVSGIDYYTAFSNWKTSCIVQGVYRRYVDGALDTTGVDVPGFRNVVLGAADSAAEAIRRLDPTF